MAIDLPNIEGKVKIDDSDLDKVARKLSELSRANADFAKSSDGASKANKRQSDSLFEVVKAGALMAGTMKLIKFPAMISGANLAAQGLSALAAGAIAFVSAIGPALGAVAALPGLMASAGQAMGVTKLATAGLKDELKALQKAAGDPFVPQATKDFAKFLFDMQPLLNDLRDTAAKGLFPGVEAGLNGLKRIFPEVQAAVAATAAELGSLAQRAGEMLGAGVFRRDFAVLANANVQIIHNLGESALFLTDALRQVMVAASPMTVAFSRMALAASKYLAEAVGAEGATERMTGFFSRSQDVLEQLGRVLANLGQGLFNVFKGGAELGAELLAGLVRITDKFAEWTSSVSGQNAIKKFFDDARQPLKEIGLLIGDITKAFGDLNSKVDLGDVISQVRTELLPALKDLLDTSGKLFTEELVTLVTKFVKTLSTFGTETGALTTFVTLLGKMLDVVNALGKIPGFVEFVATLGILRGTMAAFQFAGFLTGFSSLSTLLPKVAAAIPTMITNFRLLWALFSANPIGLVITAVAALAAGLIYAYNHSETFRKLVDEAFAAIKVAAAAAVDGIIGFLQKMVAFWFDTADNVLSAAEAMFGWIPGVGEKLATARSNFDSFRSNVEGNLERAKNASEAWKNKAIGDFIAIGNEVTRLPPVKSIEIKAVDNASANIQRINNMLNGITSKTVYVNTVHRDSQAGFGRHSGGPIYHDGGPVAPRRSFHGGGLKGDEVAAKLQVGEFVLQRSAVKALGISNLQRLNAAGGQAASVGGNTYNLNFNLPFVMDPSKPQQLQTATKFIRDQIVKLETAGK